MPIVNMIDGKEVDFSKEVLIWCNDKLESFHEINNMCCFRCILIIAGTGIININGNRITFNAPALFCLNETEKVTMEKSANISAKLVYFHPMAMNYRLNYTNLRECGSLSGTEKNDRTYLKPFFTRTDNYLGFIDIGINITKRLDQLFESIKREISEKNVNWPCNARSFFLEMLLCIERFYIKHPSTDYFLLGENLNEIEDVLIHIHLNYNSRITISDLTKSFNINRTSLNEQFRKAMNTSVMTYLLKFRIKIATALLRDSMIPVSEVAERVGYSDVTNFNRAFKKYTNLKPTEYRQQNCWLAM